MSNLPPEYQLLCFWRYPADGVQRLIEQIGESGFEIQEATYLRWTRERIVDNFQRFYAMLSGMAYQKYTEAGAAPFLFVIVRDPAPVHQYRVAGGSGYKKVNIRSFDLKQKLRRQKGTSLHATNTHREFRRDLMYLMGRKASEYQPRPGGWDGEIPTIDRDVIGADGWTSLAQVFEVLHEAVDYVVLRNFEGLPDEHVLGPHGDIDFLVEDVDARNRAASILNKEQKAHTKIGERKIYFDFRSVEDFYYDPEWCRRILRDKVAVRGVNVPSPEDYFFSLLYHGHVQKPKISKDYIPRLMALANEIGLDHITEDMLTEPDKAAIVLDDFLKGNGFYLTRPNGCPQYNPEFVRKVPNAPFLYQSASNFYNELMAIQGNQGAQANGAAGANGSSDLVAQMRGLEEAVHSRKWLARALLTRLKDYPADLRKRLQRPGAGGLAP